MPRWSTHCLYCPRNSAWESPRSAYHGILWYVSCGKKYSIVYSSTVYYGILWYFGIVKDIILVHLKPKSRLKAEPVSGPLLRPGPEEPRLEGSPGCMEGFVHGAVGDQELVFLSLSLVSLALLPSGVLLLLLPSFWLYLSLLQKCGSCSACCCTTLVQVLKVGVHMHFGKADMGPGARWCASGFGLGSSSFGRVELSTYLFGRRFTLKRQTLHAITRPQKAKPRSVCMYISVSYVFFHIYIYIYICGVCVHRCIAGTY